MLQLQILVIIVAYVTLVSAIYAMHQASCDNDIVYSHRLESSTLYREGRALWASTKTVEPHSRHQQPM